MTLGPGIRMIATEAMISSIRARPSITIKPYLQIGSDK